MLITEDGIVMDVKVLTNSNALFPMLVTDDGMVIDASLVL